MLKLCSGNALVMPNDATFVTVVLLRSKATCFAAFLEEVLGVSENTVEESLTLGVV